MFGRNRARTFKPVPFGSSRRKREVPSWLIWLAVGLIAGVFGLLTVQEIWLPKRLGIQESAALQASEKAANVEKQRAENQLAEATKGMESAVQLQKAAEAKRDDALASVAPLTASIDQFLKVLPPDPRGQTIAVRAGQFQQKAAALSYQLLVTREKGEAFAGQIDFVVKGLRGGKEQSIAVPAQTLQFNGFKQVAGDLPVPDGMTVKEVTVRLLGADASKGPVSFRVFRLG